MHLPSEGLDCLAIISTNNSRPIMAVCLQADLSNMHVPKRCGRPKPVADVSVALFSLLKVSKFQVENKRKLYLP